MYEIRKHKSDIREFHLAARREITADKRAELDDKICRAVLASATYRYADTILMYYAKDDEVNITPSRGKP